MSLALADVSVKKLLCDEFLYLNNNKIRKKGERERERKEERKERKKEGRKARRREGKNNITVWSI